MKNRTLLFFNYLVSFLLFLDVSFAFGGEVIMSGFLRSKSVVPIRIRSEREWSFKIVELVPEGKRVQEGELLVRVEGDNILRNMTEAENRIAERRVSLEANENQMSQQVQTLESQLKELQEQLDVMRIQGNAESSSPETESYRNMTVSQRERLIEKLELENLELRRNSIQKKLDSKKRLRDASRLARRAEFQNLEFSLARFQKDLENFSVRSPRSGVVLYRRNSNRQKPKVGSNSYRGSEILAVVDDKNLFVECYLRESDLSFVKIGAPVSVKVGGQNESLVQGKVSTLSPVVMKVGDWERSLQKTHPLYRLRAFKVTVELEGLPPDARPDGDVLVLLNRG